MLRIFYGDMEGVVYNTSSYFKFNYEPQWLSDPEVIQMIRDVDKSEVLGNGAIDSPYLGVIPPTDLSGGVKTLILIDKVQDKVFNASNCGDNCAKWLLKIAENRDITVNLRHLMDFGDEPFSIVVLNDDIKATNMRDLNRIAGGYV